MIDGGRLSKLMDRERHAYRERNPRSLAAYQSARAPAGSRSTSPGPVEPTSRTWTATTSQTSAWATPARCETHTFSAGPGGCTKAWDLAPDMLTIGKAIAGGIPTGAYGLSEEVADKVSGRTDLDLIDVGGTLAGNALSVAAMRATLEHVLTDAAFEAMDFSNPAPSNGGDSNAASDPELDDFLHVYLANRDVLMTPFHNMALMCPATTQADVNSHHRVRGLSLNHPLSSCRMLPPSTTSDCPVM